MKYAVVRFGTSQFKVEEGQEILLNKLATQKPEAEVLMLRDAKAVKVGDPLVKGAKVSLKVVGDEKGKKIHVYKYKSKSRYRRKIGSRPSYTRLLVEKIA